jgi:Tol biopolymer transport system component
VLDRPREAARYVSLALSPDGTRAVVNKENPENSVDRDLWLIDLSRGTNKRITFDGLADAPAWSDGDRIVFWHDHDVLQKPVGGAASEQVLLHSAEYAFPTSVSSDGRFLLYDVIGRGPTRTDLWVLPLVGDRKPVPFANEQFDQIQGQFSPDGQWVAYTSNESGANEVLVRPFSPDSSAGSARAAESVLVSKNGGASPRWRGDGRELFYLSADGTVMAVSVSANHGFTSETPKPLFRAAGLLPDWGVTADGQRFLFAVPTGQGTPSPFTVVLNWQAGLKK